MPSRTSGRVSSGSGSSQFALKCGDPRRLFLLRRDRVSFAGDFRSDSPGEFAERTIIDELGHLGLAQDVNETESHNLPGGIDDLGGARVA